MSLGIPCPTSAGPSVPMCSVRFTSPSDKPRFAASAPSGTAGCSTIRVMPLIYILTLALQAALIVHVLKTGRNNLWIWAIALLPGAGSLAYIGVEIVPEIFGGRAGRRTRASVQRIIDPDRDLRQAAAAVELSGNVDARRRLAEELYERGQYTEAAAVYEGGLKGIFEHDPVLLLGLARSRFASGDFGSARASLEQLFLHN